MKRIIFWYSAAIFLIIALTTNQAYADSKTAKKLVPVVMLLMDDGSRVRSVTLSINFTSPTTREDDSPLSLSEVASYSLRYRVEGTTAYQYATLATSVFASPSILATIEADFENYELSIATLDTNGRKGRYSSNLVVDLKL